MDLTTAGFEEHMKLRMQQLECKKTEINNEVYLLDLSKLECKKSKINHEISLLPLGFLGPDVYYSLDLEELPELQDLSI